MGRKKKTPSPLDALATSEDRKKHIRDTAEADLLSFIRLVAPYRVIGHAHEDLCNWWTRQGASNHQLVLLPRDHGKSAFIAYRCAWEIVRRPDIRILYISSTSGLAEKQLKFIKDILTSKIFRYYWPEYVNEEEGKREKWTNSEMAIDHPKRKAEGIRDSTVFTGGLTTSLTGFHCDIAVLDDVVVQENAYSPDGRKKVEEQYSLLSSIEGTDSSEWVVGTRYHPKDLYATMVEMAEDVFDEAGSVVDKRNVYEVFERQVEDKGDGTGEFLWPRTMRRDGKWFGFSKEILAQKRAKYIDKTQFRAQYYNDPNDTSEARIARSKFQYYDKKFLTQSAGYWYYNGRRLNVYAAVDFAFSTKAKADYTAIAVVGMDSQKNVFVLDIDRFKTNQIGEYYRHILDMHIKWNLRKLRAEINAAQEVIVRELKDQYLRPNGITLPIEEHRPTRTQGAKEDRIAAILEPKYNNMAIYHYKGGNCELLEEELVLQNPPHDDIKDALASVVEIAIPPISQRSSTDNRLISIVSNNRFGGIK